MASTNWIYMSPNLKKGLHLINKLDSKKFQSLLNRIVMEIKQNDNTFSSFTSEDYEKLLSILFISFDELVLLLNSCAIIIHQAVYNKTNPEKLKKILIEELKLNEDKAVSFANIWHNNAKNMFLKLKQKSVYSSQLQDVSWLVNIEIASENSLQTFVPKSVLQLKLKEENGPSNLDLELNEKDLFKLYNALENIQGALDSLS